MNRPERVQHPLAQAVDSNVSKLGARKDRAPILNLRSHLVSAMDLRADEPPEHEQDRQGGVNRDRRPESCDCTGVLGPPL
jgi:hypothetical protein